MMAKSELAKQRNREELIIMRACDNEPIDDLSPTDADLKAYEDYRAIVEAGYMPELPFDPE